MALDLSEEQAVHVLGLGVKKRERERLSLNGVPLPSLQCRVFPKGRMCMIFDMNGCGLSQMDMELMRFIVNCFKIYFPDMLAMLLVFNMPWILQGQLVNYHA